MSRDGFDDWGYLFIYIIFSDRSGVYVGMILDDNLPGYRY